MSAICVLAAGAVALHAEQAAKPPANTIYVGVLEDDRGEFSAAMRYEQPPSSEPAKKRVARILFVKTSSRWAEAPLQQLASSPGEFTVAFDGKNMGQIKVRARQAMDGDDEPHIREITTPAAQVPQVGTPSKQFGGTIGFVTRRPLVLVAPANFRDPDGWKRHTGNLPEPVLRTLRKVFAERYPTVEICGAGGAHKKWQYTPAEIQTPIVYFSRTEEYLIQTKFSRESGCDPSDDVNNPWNELWFVVKPDLTVRGLGGLLILIDAGDYDNDGKSELLFLLAERSQETYVMFSDDFQQKVFVSSWNYGPN